MSLRNNYTNKIFIMADGEDQYITIGSGRWEISMESYIREGSIYVYAPVASYVRIKHYADGDAVLEGNVYGDVFKCGGKGNAIRRGSGKGDAVVDCCTYGNYAIREGSGKGDAILEGKSYTKGFFVAGRGIMMPDEGGGTAIRRGSGDGNAIVNNKVAGTAIREGSGNGTAFRIGNGNGSAIKQGRGKGTAYKYGRGSGYARINGKNTNEEKK